MERDLVPCDVCIIGGSIAGNYLCYLLSKTNLKIIVIEEHTKIGLPFQCAGIISQKISTLIDLPKELVLNRVNTAKIVSSAGDYIKLKGNENPFIIDRVGLDLLFYNRIKDKKNVTYLLGEKFKTFEYSREDQTKFVVIETTNRKIKAKMLIGCDGPLTAVGRILGLKNQILYAKQIRVNSNFPENEAVMVFNKKWNELFGWIVPEGNKVYRIGIASSKNIAENFRIFLKMLQISQEYKIDQQGGLIPYGIMNKVAFDNVLLLGDAAGQVKATTGGGIIMLLTAAKYAAYCIQKCFTTNKFTVKKIKKYYQNQCELAIGRELKIHFIIRAFLEKMSTKDFKKVFQIIKSSKIENLISIYGDMDFPRNLIFKIVKNPLFISFLIKYLVKNPQMFFKIVKLI
ncbi:MAG: hypothetical protein ACFFDF_07370 [Candidatus Odinarchaeota archaeon]